MNIQTAQDPVMNLYALLDEMQELFKIMGNGFRVKAGDIEVTLPPDQVVDRKNKYMQLRSQIQKLANSIPDVVNL